MDTHNINDATQQDPLDRKAKKAFQFELKKLQEKKKHDLSKIKDKRKREEINKKYEEEEKYLQRKLSTSTKVNEPHNIPSHQPLHPPFMNLDENETEEHLKIKSVIGNKKNKSKQEKQLSRILKLQAEYDEENKERQAAYDSSKRENELQILLEALKQNQLEIYDITPDGNCLYRAIAHQIEFLHNRDPNVCTYTYNELRQITSQYIQEHKEHFLPFITNENKNEAAFDEYCREIRETSEWGGELELQALSSALGYKIIVYGGSKPFEKFTYGEHEGGEVINLAFERFKFSSGEHYNSLIKKT